MTALICKTDSTVLSSVHFIIYKSIPVKNYMSIINQKNRNYKTTKDHFSPSRLAKIKKSDRAEYCKDVERDFHSLLLTV